MYIYIQVLTIVFVLNKHNFSYPPKVTDAIAI